MTDGAWLVAQRVGDDAMWRFWLLLLIGGSISGALSWLCAHLGEPVLGAILGVAVFCWLLKAYAQMMG